MCGVVWASNIYVCWQVGEKFVAYDQHIREQAQRTKGRVNDIKHQLERRVENFSKALEEEMRQRIKAEKILRQETER